MIGDDEYDGLAGRASQVNGMCTLTHGKAFDVAVFRMNLAMLEAVEEEAEDEKDEGEKEECRSRL